MKRFPLKKLRLRTQSMIDRRTTLLLQGNLNLLEFVQLLGDLGHVVAVAVPELEAAAAAEVLIIPPVTVALSPTALTLVTAAQSSKTPTENSIKALKSCLSWPSVFHQNPAWQYAAQPTCINFQITGRGACRRGRGGGRRSTRRAGPPPAPAAAPARSAASCRYTA